MECNDHRFAGHADEALQNSLSLIAPTDRITFPIFCDDNRHLPGIFDMSIDKSLKRKNTLSRARSVLTRAERIKTLQDQEKWIEGRSPFALPKVRVIKIVLKKAKKEKAAETAEGAETPEAAAGGEAKAK
jgi:small basic protein (TIGR04137 family)